MKVIRNNQDFKAIMSSDKPVVLDFYADWCGPCRVMLPVLEGAEKDFGDKVVFAKVDVDEHPTLAAQFAVRSIPTVFFVKDAQIVDQFKGLQSRKEIESYLNRLVSPSEVS